MPDKEELEMRTSEFLDQQDTACRRSRMLPWRKCMEPSPETDEADEAEEAGRSAK